MTDYISRVVDGELDDLLRQLPAIALEGPKGVGKTATAERRSGRVLRLDDPSIRALADADPAVLLAAPGPLLLDEWQRVPALWDAVRRAVDAGARPGSFLLTGSAAPAGVPTHSGAGRVVRLRMRPLSLAERRLVEPTVSLAGLLAGSRGPVVGHSDMTLAAYVREIASSGFPGIRPLAGRARRLQLDGYLARIVDRDFEELGRPVRRPAALRRWMAAYAAATATTATYEKIRAAASPGEGDPPTKVTTIAYRDILERLWILDPVPGWLPSGSRLARLTQAPKHHLADPALAARLLDLDASGFLAAAGPAPAPGEAALLGRLFESLVTQSVRVLAQAADATVHHLRTHDGRQEVDLVLERGGGVLALEVKLGGEVTDADVRHLHWLGRRLGGDLLDAAVITTGADAYRRPDGVAVVPAALLGP